MFSDVFSNDHTRTVKRENSSTVDNFPDEEMYL